MRHIQGEKFTYGDRRIIISKKKQKIVVYWNKTSKLFVRGWQQQRIVNSDPFFCKFIVGKRVLARACHGFRPIKSGSARHKHHLALKKKSQEFSKQKYFIATPWTSSVCKSRNKSTKRKLRIRYLYQCYQSISWLFCYPLSTYFSFKKVWVEAF